MATTEYATEIANYSDWCEITAPEQIWSPILLGIFSIAGIIGNITLLAVILLNANLRTSPNIMMMNLTLGDLLYLLMSAPIHVEHEIHPCWQFGSVGCKFINSLQVVGVCVCVLSLTAVSVERYLAITRHVRIGRGKKRCQTATVVTVIWILAIVFGLPMALMAKIEFEMFCIPLPFDHILSKMYVLVVFVCMYVIPLSLIAMCYVKMASALVRSTQSFKGESQTAGARQFIMRRRVAFIVLAMSVFFGAFWFPFHIYNIWFHFVYDPLAAETVASHFFRQFHYFMALANSCFNPWIVFLMSSKHRKGVMRCFRKEEDGFKCRSLQSVSRARSSGNWATDHGNQYTEMSGMKTEDGTTFHDTTKEVHHPNNVYKTS